MDALQAAQSIYASTIKNLAGKDVELDPTTALQVATFCTGLAQAEALERIADALERWVGPEALVDPELAAYHKYSLTGESIDEYRRRIAEYVADNS